MGIARNDDDTNNQETSTGIQKRHYGKRNKWADEKSGVGMDPQK